MKMNTPWKVSFALAAILASGATVNVAYQWSSPYWVKKERHLASGAEETGTIVVNPQITDAVTTTPAENLLQLRQDLGSIRQDVESIKQRQQEILAQIKLQDDNSAEVTRLNGELTRLNQQLETSKSELAAQDLRFQTEVGRLTTERDQLNAAKTQLDERLNTANQANAQLLTELDGARATLEAKKNLIADLEAKKLQLETELEQEKGSNTALRAELERVNASIEQARSLIAGLEAAKTELISRLQSTEAELLTSKSENERLLAEKADLLRQLEVARVSIDESTRRIATLEGELTTTRQTLQEKEAVIAQNVETINAREEQIKALNVRQCENERSIRQLGSDVQTLVQDKQKVIDAALEQEQLMTKSLDEKDAELKKKDDDFKKKEEEFKLQSVAMQQSFAQSLGQMMMFFQMSQSSMQQPSFLSNPLNNGSQNDMLLMMLLMNNGRSSNGFSIPSYGYGFQNGFDQGYNMNGYPGMGMGMGGRGMIAPDYYNGGQPMGGFPSYPRSMVNGPSNNNSGGFAF
jgi:hypothetical protein